MRAGKLAAVELDRGDGGTALGQEFHVSYRQAAAAQLQGVQPRRGQGGQHAAHLRA